MEKRTCKHFYSIPVYQYTIPELILKLNGSISKPITDFLKTGYRYRYRCDVTVRDHPTDQGLCYSDVTFQLLQNASFKVGPKTM